MVALRRDPYGATKENPRRDVAGNPRSQRGMVVNIHESGFDDDGQIVPVVWPDAFDVHEQSSRSTLEGAVLDFLLAAPTAALVGERSILISYILKTTAAPKTLRELGERLGVSHVAARSRLNKFKRQMLSELKDFAPQH